MADPNEIETRVSQAIAQIERDFDGQQNLRWSIVRALIHRAIHYAAEKPGVEFCALVTFLAEMIGHAHKLQHGDNPAAHDKWMH
jgi:hypothetical protein